jgi:hypothetical protein
MGHAPLGQHPGSQQEPLVDRGPKAAIRMKTVAYRGTIYEDHKGTLVPIAEQNGQASYWPSPDRAAYYGLAGEVVEVLSPHTEADPVALLLDFLCSFGSAAGPSPHAVADAAEHPARLNAVLVGKTSKARKGSSRRQVGGVFDRVDEVWARERVMGGLASGEGLIAAVADGPEGPADRRLMVVEEEFSRTLAVAAREGSTLSAIIRQAWDTGNLRVMTRKEPLRATGAHISILAHTTIEEIRRRLTDTDVLNGFANRYLFAVVRRSKRLPSGGRVSEADLSSLIRQIRIAVTDARKVGTLRRSSEAEIRWVQIYNQIADDEPGGLLGAATARADAQVLRLSVAYALTDASSTIELPHLEAAWSLWSYCAASARMLFGDRTGDDVEERLLAAIRDAGEEGLDSTGQFAVFGRHITARRLEVARASLEDQGLIYTEQVPTDGRARVISWVCEQSESAKKR